MATAAQSVSATPSSPSWLGEFLKHELSPYPGRTALVARMVIAATLVMVIRHGIPHPLYVPRRDFREHRFSRELSSHEDVVAGVVDRLAAVENLLVCLAENRSVDPLTQTNVERLAMVGTSMLRRILQRSTYAPDYAEQMGVVIALTGTLVDLAANLTSPTHLSGNDREQIRLLTENVGRVRSTLLANGAPHLNAVHLTQGNVPRAIPFVAEMGKTVQLINEILTGSQSLSAFAPQPSSGDPPRHFSPVMRSPTLRTSFALSFAFCRHSPPLVLRFITAWHEEVRQPGKRTEESL